MGVYIKGMKMPETCIECMNSGLRTAIRCTEWTEISAGLRENHRAISCHLTEVPEPHGRLIDADALMNIFADRLVFVSERYGIDSAVAGAVSGAMKLLDVQPPVIEAEDE